MSKKWVYLFSEVDEAEAYAGNWDGVRALLGGKGAGLADMNRGKLPVPPGFTVTTEACNAYLAAGEQFPAGLWEQELAAMAATEQATGKKFGDPTNPLLVSCRSGAKFSMPGMMDTVLNIGLNDETAQGMVGLTGNDKFVYDSYRRLVQMYGSVVMNVSKEDFEKVLEAYRHQRGVASDSDLPVDDLKEITAQFKKIVKENTGREYPTDPYEQLKLATEAVFKSWNGKRAFDYRNASKIPHDLGTAVNIVTMVFGNMGQDSGTGVLTTRNVSDGIQEIEGDFLINAQGEDVVSGTRQTMRMADMKAAMPVMYDELVAFCHKLEQYYRETQDIEFTVERGKLWMLQTRNAKRTAQAAIMVRPETTPNDVHGMLAAKGILTSRGGRTSHAALVARQFGIPAVVGVAAMEVNVEERQAKVNGVVYKEGDWASLDGTTGEIFAGQIATKQPDIEDPYLIRLLSWADEIRTLGVWANADYPVDAQRARKFGAEGIGLTRTEHMFFETHRLPTVQKMILAKTEAERDEALAVLLPFQRGDFDGLFRAMDGLPVTIRLIDPPMHEFLPSQEALLVEVAELRFTKPGSKELAEKEALLAAVQGMHEANPMLGLRGVRLGIHFPSLTRMQVRAIFEAACDCAKDGVDVHPKIMIPLTSHINELKVQQSALEEEAKAVMAEKGIEVDYQFGTMIEIPRAALTAGEIAQMAEFFSFGTNDLTQMTFGISRDDAEKGFLIEYIEKKILPENPFASLDETGVGRLMKIAVDEGRATRPDLQIGLCGEHGGDPSSIMLCFRLGLDYVSCSPFRVPIARLAAAHATLKYGK
jgi:pyruvate,orthophosphate dikinase